MDFIEKRALFWCCVLAAAIDIAIYSIYGPNIWRGLSISFIIGAGGQVLHQLRKQ